VELVVGVEVVGVVVVVVVVFPTVLALFLDISPAGPDVFLAFLSYLILQFSDHVCHLLYYHHLDGNHLIDSNRWRIWRIHFCLLLPDNLSFLVLTLRVRSIW
jgi:hypothetical protein